MILYPSRGDEKYPYLIWWDKNWMASAADLASWREWMLQADRILRRRYGWSPDVLDDLDVMRIHRILDESAEDEDDRRNKWPMA